MSSANCPSMEAKAGSMHAQTCMVGSPSSGLLMRTYELAIYHFSNTFLLIKTMYMADYNIKRDSSWTCTIKAAACSNSCHRCQHQFHVPWNGPTGTLPIHQVCHQRSSASLERLSDTFHCPTVPFQWDAARPHATTLNIRIHDAPKVQWNCKRPHTLYYLELKCRKQLQARRSDRRGQDAWGVLRK